MGTDTTAGGIGFQFRTIKQDAKRQRDAFHSGKDPKDLMMGGGKGASTFPFMLLFSFMHEPV
jgi:hypothetical protein